MSQIHAHIARPALPESHDVTPTMRAAGVRSLSRGVIDTAVSPRLARAMAGLFIAGIVCIPVLQLACELLGDRPIQELDVLKPPTRALLALAERQPRQAYRHLRWFLSKEHLAGYEDALHDASVARRLVQPRVQQALTRYLAFGNTQAYIARGSLHPSGWLFYQLGLDYLAGPPFLRPSVLRHREQQLLQAGEADVNADPRRAIVQFHRDCQRAGVHLVFVPIPIKHMMQPAQLGGRVALSKPIPTPNNPDYPKFLNDLRNAGVDVFDPTPPVLFPDDPVRYLQQDTHWTPQFMEAVAQGLADHIRRSIELPPPARVFSVRIVEERARHLGDIAATLQLPPRQTLFRPQTLALRRVLDAATGQDWRPDPDADILLLGDSFSNIYSEEHMGWGRSAGFPQHLSRLLARSLDVIAHNGQAANEVRRALAARSHPLAGKRVIVWQVAMHELATSNWPIIRLLDRQESGQEIHR